MLDHVSIGVSDLARSIALYDAVFAPLGYVRLWSDRDAAGYGRPGCDDGFAIKHDSSREVRSSYRSHVAFATDDPLLVERFYRAAIAHGCADDGPPGLCPEYGAGYFAAFVRDPDGYRIEAVCHLPAGESL